jgi:hypothetical protein
VFRPRAWRRNESRRGWHESWRRRLQPSLDGSVTVDESSFVQSSFVQPSLDARDAPFISVDGKTLVAFDRTPVDALDASFISVDRKTLVALDRATVFSDRSPLAGPVE